MGVILFALGIAILTYIGLVLAFPKVVPEEKASFTQQALDRIYEETTIGADNMDRDIELALKSQLEDAPPLARLFFSTPLTRPMYDALVQAGYADQAQTIALYFMGGSLLFVFGALYIGFGLFSLLLGPLLAYLIAYRHCMGRVRKRNAQFLSQFPDVIDMVVRSIRAGFPLNTAMQMIAENMEEPSKTEFRYVLNDIALGRSINQALTRLTSRVNEQDVKFFAVMVAIQQETGGNLAEILNNLSTILRKRKLLRDKLRALTSEGRATGWILSALPVFVFLALMFIQPDYLKPLWTHPLGMMFFGTAIGLVAFCNFIVRRMIDIEI
jgi:tight adherence protein B